MQWIKYAIVILTISYEGVCASSGIQEFLDDNGHRHVDIFCNSTQGLRFTLKNVFVARVYMENVEKAYKDSFGIFLFDNAKDDLVSYLTSITQRQTKTSLLVIAEPWDIDIIKLIKKHLSDMQATAFDPCLGF